VWRDTLVAHAVTDPQVKHAVTDDELDPALDTNEQLFASVRDGIGPAVLPGRDEEFVRVEFGIAKITGKGFDTHVPTPRGRKRRVRKQDLINAAHTTEDLGPLEANP